MTKDAALKLALKALENGKRVRDGEGGTRYQPELEDAAITAIKEALAQPAQEPVAKYCCHVCFDKSGQTFLDRMILCSECGNKRCPKATNHALPCTNNNNPLQLAKEPVAWRYRGNLHEFDPSDWATGPVTPLYTTPPQRPWVGLTNKERSGIEDYCEMIIGKAAFDAIEAKLKEKNT